MNNSLLLTDNAKKTNSNAATTFVRAFGSIFIGVFLPCHIVLGGHCRLKVHCQLSVIPKLNLATLLSALVQNFKAAGKNISICQGKVWLFYTAIPNRIANVF